MSIMSINLFSFYSFYIINLLIENLKDIIFNFNKIKFQQLNVLWFLVLLILFLIFLLRKKFVNEKNLLIKKRGLKFTIFVFRVIFFTLLLLALSYPYIEKPISNETMTKLKVLIDDSESMKIYDLTLINETLKNLNKSINLEVKYLGLKESAIGNAILNNLKPEENVLVITDGQNNFGVSLNDVALFSNNIKSKIFALKLKPDYNDYSVVIDGPDKVVRNSENTFLIKVNSVKKTPLNNNPITLNVYLDEQLIFTGKTDKYELKKSFDSGNHIIKAIIQTDKDRSGNDNKNNLDKNRLDEDDVFKENNVYYKTINVYEKPKVLMISNSMDSSFEKIFKELYELDVKQKLPEDKKELYKYYAIILNDIHSNVLSDKDIDNLENFVVDGNGLFVIGGKNSYDWADYNKSLLMNILPVSVGKANKKKDITNIVILFDSGVSAVEELSPGITQFDVQKTMTADLIKSISNTNKVAVIEANYYLNTISGLSELGPKKSELINEIALLKPKGISELRFAYQNAYEMLRLTKGSKNIVIITDGLFRDEKFIQENKYALDQEVTLKLAEKAAQDNIKTFVIGVGEKADEQYLKALKDKGNGEYFKITENSKIKLYFGDPNENTDELKVFVYDSNHFITKDLNDLGKLYGFNSVYPKENARLLLTSSKGDPILTIWNFGLGRVASLTTYDEWAPDLFSLKGSKVLVKTMNWLIEDPERKNKLIINVPELRANENNEITIKIDDSIKLNEKLNSNELTYNFKSHETNKENTITENTGSLKLYEIRKGLFKSNIYFNETGLIKIFDNLYAVNYRKEYLNLGFNEELEKITQISGGILIEDNNLILDDIKSKGIIHTTKIIPIQNLFLILAILTYLMEIFVRRLFEIQYSKKLD
ncbi:MAG: VWA domain-containing protein [Candidatus Woesearchaeota archaeon]